MVHYLNKYKTYIKNSLPIGIAFLAIGLIAYYLIYQTLTGNISESISEHSAHCAKIVEVNIKRHLDVLETIASNYTVKSSTPSLEDKMKFLESEVKKIELKRLCLVDRYGNSRTTDNKEVQVADRTYFIKALSGQKNVSEPILSRVDGTMVIVYAVPLREANSITGVLYASFDATTLCGMIAESKPEIYYNLFIINKNGTVVADENGNYVYPMSEVLNTTKKNFGKSPSPDLQAQMNEGKIGAGECTYKGTASYIAFRPIEGTDWSIVLTLPKSHANGNMNQMLTILLLLVIIIALLLIAVNLYTRYLRINLLNEKSTVSKVIDAAKVIIMYIDPYGKILFFNEFAEEKTGYRKDEVINLKTIFDLVPESEHEKLKDILKAKDDKLQHISGFEFKLIDKDGQLKHVLGNVDINENLPENNSQSIELIGIDITSRVEAEQKLIKNNQELTSMYTELGRQYDELCAIQEKLVKSEERYTLALEGANDGIWYWEKIDGNFNYSDKFREMLGYSENELGTSHKNLIKYIHPDDLPVATKADQDHFNGLTPFLSYEARILTRGVNYKWFLIRGKAVSDKDGNLIRIAGSLSDIDERKTSEQLIRKLAYYDALTDLPNRFMLYNKLDNALKAASEGSEKGALVLIDLNNFKNINDSYGHSFGDLLLREISGKLTACTADTNITVFRPGNDEFEILIENLEDKTQCENYISMIMNIFSSPFSVGSRSIHITSSMGISLFPDDSSDVETLIKNTDTAMNFAKKNKKRKYMFYDKSMNEEIVQKMELESKLRNAIQNNEFILHYQPQIDLKSSKIRGFEALIRWQSPDHGLILPANFINTAEETGLIIPIGNWVLKSACKLNKYLHDNGYNDCTISANISMIQLIQDDFVDIVSNTLSETGLEPEYLELELTESVLMESIEQCLKKLEALRKKGIKISLDDFGKGYSSFSYLNKLPVNVLKIDKSFIDDIGKSYNITESIVHFGHKMGLNIIAEGVENSEQLDYLIRSDCNIVQGYFFSKPVPEQEVIEMIKTNKIMENKSKKSEIAQY